TLSKLDEDPDVGTKVRVSVQQEPVLIGSEVIQPCCSKIWPLVVIHAKSIFASERQIVSARVVQRQLLQPERRVALNRDVPQISVVFVPAQESGRVTGPLRLLSACESPGACHCDH